MLQYFLYNSFIFVTHLKKMYGICKKLKFYHTCISCYLQKNLVLSKILNHSGLDKLIIQPSMFFKIQNGTQFNNFLSKLSKEISFCKQLLPHFHCFSSTTPCLIGDGDHTINYDNIFEAMHTVQDARYLDCRTDKQIVSRCACLASFVCVCV